MFSGDKSFVYGSSTHNQRIEWFWDDYEICKEETVDLPNMPCDDTVYELCCLLMEEGGWDLPLNTQDGKDVNLVRTKKQK
ncbi:hypothetical protein KUTeg_010697 [Tegillarca granosa]|uniref:Uncharacterized protein n=1 Tax=Tegillarca granosa TaxID=220873 RepID=A0ABQ9F4Y6_TEGGR|nr:hypothetical protein KUTeg_010697 [Tegillarca granosa]